MTKTQHFFISDLHLCDERPDLTQAFFAFLSTTFPTENAAEESTLYILGDFFDVWIGDDNPSALINTVSNTIHTFTEQGLTVYLMHGNRDFLMGDDFAARCGATIISEPFPITLFEHTYLLIHGDSLCTQDEDYQQFRTMVRAPQWQQAFLSKPIAERQAFADQARSQSKSMNSNKAEDIMDVTPTAVSDLMQEYQVNSLIHGHTHRPAVHALENQQQRIVLGDWDKNGWVLQITSEEEELRHFSI